MQKDALKTEYSGGDRGKKSRGGRRAARYLLLLVLFAAVCAAGWFRLQKEKELERDRPERTAEGTNYPEYLERFGLPEYRGESAAVINGNLPFFDLSAETKKAYEYYGERDRLGRCTYAEACVGKELMPEQERGDISTVRPTGWRFNRVYDFIEDGFLYNRCHLIAFTLTGEDDNADNLVTGTRYMNTEGMLPVELQVSGYIHRTGNHVHYRVTPVFRGSDLLASGVLIEARSVEDDGEGLCLCVYCFNVQPGVAIDYADGENRAENAP